MVDTPKLTPQAFSKRQTSGVPRLQAQAPNFRAAPSVNAFAAQSEADMLISMADDAKRLEMVAGGNFNISAQQFQKAQDDIKEDQLIEKEAILAESSFLIEQEIEAARQGSNLADIPENTMKAYDAVVKRTLEKDDLSDYQRGMLEQDYASSRIKVAGQAVKYQAELRKVEQANNFARIVTAKSMDVYNKPEKYDAFIKEGRGKLSQKQFEAARKTLAEAAIKGMAATPDGAKKLEIALDQGKFDDAISPNDKFTYERLAKSSQAKEKIERTTDQLQELGEFRANLQENPNNYTATDIDLMRTKHDLTDGEVTNMFTMKERASLELEDKQSRKSDIQARMQNNSSGGTQTISPKRKEDIEDLNLLWNENYQEKVSSLKQSGDTAAAMSHTANFINNSGFVPQSLKEEVVGAIRNGDVTEQVYYTGLYNRLQEDQRGKTLDFGMSAEDIAYSDRISEVLAYQSDPEVAVQQVRQEFANPAREVRLEIFKSTPENGGFDENKAWEAFQDLYSNLDDDDSFFVNSGMKNQVLNELRATAKSYAINSPTVGDKMYERAAQLLAPNYRYSSADGVKRPMKYAPEAVLNISPQIAQVMLANEIKSVAPELEMGDYSILADDHTARQVAAGLSPSYAIMIIDEGESINQLQVDGEFKRVELTPPNADDLRRLDKEARVIRRDEKTKRKMATKKQILFGMD
jgi:hypothetical protein